MLGERRYERCPLVILPYKGRCIYAMRHLAPIYVDTSEVFAIRSIDTIEIMLAISSGMIEIRR